ncbi:MAG: uroporphyrinogen decarboxylase family protein [Limisphaerales bacterium]
MKEEQSAFCWTSRQRVEAAINHRESDRVPFDLGGTILTGIHRIAYERLREYLGLPKIKIEIEDPFQQLAKVDEDVKEKLKVDVWGINPSAPSDSPQRQWTEDGYSKIRDEWGIEWWMPLDGGFYHDMRRHPLENINTVEELKKVKFPDPEDPARFANFAEMSEQLMNKRQVAYVLGRNAAGIFEVALWLRGFENFFCDMIENLRFAEALLDTVCEIKMRYWAKALQIVGKNVMIVSEADDLASQNRCFISVEMYRRFLKPRHKRLFYHIKKSALVPVKIFFHSCGAVRPLIPDLIEAGVDILNPVQVSAAGMDSAELKKEFGKEIVFYGGGVDTQYILPRGSVAQVKDDVKRRIDDLAPGGGFVFAAVHNIQADVPPQNIMAMWEALQEYGVY